MWAPAAADLTTAGKPSSAAACGRSSRVLGDPLGDDGQAVSLEQLSRLGRIEPGVVGAGERALDDERSSGAIDPFEHGDGPERPPEPLGALRDAAQCSCRRLRVGEGSGGRAGAQRLRDAVRAHDDGEDRLLGSGGASGRVDGDRYLVGRRADGGYEEHERRVDLRVLQHDRQRLPVARRGRRSEHVDGVRDAGLGGQQLAQPGGGFLAESG